MLQGEVDVKEVNILNKALLLIISFTIIACQTTSNTKTEENYGANHKQREYFQSILSQDYKRPRLRLAYVRLETEQHIRTLEKLWYPGIDHLEANAPSIVEIEANGIKVLNVEVIDTLSLDHCPNNKAVNNHICVTNKISHQSGGSFLQTEQKRLGFYIRLGDWQMLIGSSGGKGIRRIPEQENGANHLAYMMEDENSWQLHMAHKYGREIQF